MPIELSQEDRKAAIASVRRYAEEHFDESLGELAAGLLLDFVLEEIGPSIYNGAVRDAQARMQSHLGELDLDVHEEEFQYSLNQGWKRS